MTDKYDDKRYIPIAPFLDHIPIKEIRISDDLSMGMYDIENQWYYIPFWVIRKYLEEGLIKQIYPFEKV
jgi:hypothetical protein